MFRLDKKPNRSNKVRKSMLGTENLETRRMLAGDVVVEFNASGDLLITGDGADNYFTVAESQVPNIKVTGFFGTNIVVDGVPDESHTIEATAGRDFIIDTGGGDDTAEISFVSVPRTMRAFLRNGDDNLTITGVSTDSHLSVSSGAGIDVIHLTDVTVDGSTNISGGDGTDLLRVSESTLGSALTMNGGGGHNVMQLDSIDGLETEVVLNGDEGEDQVESNASNFASAIFNLSAGDDTWMDSDSLINGQVDLELGAGVDRVTTQGTRITGDLNLQFDVGSDSIAEFANLTSTTISGSAEFRGSVGRQQVNADALSVGGRFFTAFGGGNDSVETVDSFFSAVDLKLGSGDDELSFINSQFNGALIVDLNGGVDEFNATDDNLFFGSATIGGGNGNQDLVVIGHAFDQGATLTRFENVTFLPNPIF